MLGHVETWEESLDTLKALLEIVEEKVSNAADQEVAALFDVKPKKFKKFKETVNKAWAMIDDMKDETNHKAYTDSSKYLKSKDK